MIRVVATIAAGAVLSTPDQPPTARPVTPLPPALVELDARIAEIHDLRAEFEQRKHTPLLKRPLVSRGTVVARSDRVRWDTESPRRSSLVADREEIRIYYPDERIVEVYTVAGDLRPFAGSPLPRLGDLTEYFDVSTIDPSGMADGPLPARSLAAQLLPRTPALKDAIASVRVLFDGAVPCVTRVVMTDPDGERTEIEFKEVRTNAGLPDSATELRVPPGTREVRPIGGKPPEPGR